MIVGNGNVTNQTQTGGNNNTANINITGDTNSVTQYQYAGSYNQAYATINGGHWQQYQPAADRQQQLRQQHDQQWQRQRACGGTVRIVQYRLPDG